MPEQIPNDDMSRVRHLYAHIAKIETFEEWLDRYASAWGMTPREMIEQGRAEEVINALEAIYSGAYV